MTQQLFNFWRKLGFKPVYLRQTANDITGEHTLIVIRSMNMRSGEGDDDIELADQDWLPNFVEDFKSRFLSLLGQAFSAMPLALALSIVDPTNSMSPMCAHCN